MQTRSKLYDILQYHGREILIALLLLSQARSGIVTPVEDILSYNY